MNSIVMPVAPTLDELNDAALTARAERDVLLRQRAELDAGVPTEPTARAEWFEAHAELPRLNAALYRARARSEQADNALRDARERHYRAVREELTPERRVILQRLAKALDAAASASRDVQELDAYAELETDAHGFTPGQSMAFALTADGCAWERLKRELQRDGWV